jgi:7-carboxy-7-deazaguanine synthase
MRISETFYSVQGEGALLGVPSFFIRTSGCNLRCTWCDTPYASWQPEGEERTVAQLVAEVQQHPGCRHVVVTGGEPMIARGIESLLGILAEGGWHTTVETAATIPPPAVPVALASLSPKLAHSTPTVDKAGAWAAKHEAARLRPEIIRAWIDHAAAWQLKFVVSATRVAEDVAEIEHLLAEIGSPGPPERIILMPEGITAPELAAGALGLVETCLHRGWRLSPRLHVDLWGHRRGV